MEALEDQQRLLGIVVQDARHEAGSEAGVQGQRRLLEAGPLERQLPRPAEILSAGQRLFDADLAGRALGDEDRAELARRDLVDLPQHGPAAEPGCDLGQVREIAAEPVLGHLAIGNGAEDQHPSDPMR